MGTGFISDYPEGSFYELLPQNLQKEARNSEKQRCSQGGLAIFRGPSDQEALLITRWSQGV